MKETRPFQIPGMTPWLCEYTGQDGHKYGITLYGSDPDQIERDYCVSLWGLVVVGQLIATIEG